MSEDDAKQAHNPYAAPANEGAFDAPLEARAVDVEAAVRGIGIAAFLAAADHVASALFLTSLRRTLPPEGLHATIVNGLSLGAFAAAIGLGFAGQRLRRLDVRGVELLRNVLVVDVACAIGQWVVAGARSPGMLVTWCVRLAIGAVCWRYVSRGPGARVLTGSYHRALVDPNDSTISWRWVALLSAMMLAGHLFGGVVTGFSAFR